MTDRIGALELPARESGSVTDPLLDAFGGFLSSYINATLADEWSRVSPGIGLPVTEVIACSVERATFDDSRLPALFLFRQDDDNQRLADELFEVTTRLYAVWVPPLADTAAREVIAPMGNGVAKAIKHALRLGRHPHWVVRGDTDPSAATLGSVLMEHANISEEPRILKTQFDPNIRVRVEGAAPVEYDATLVTIQCVELSDFDPALRGVDANISVDVSQGALSIEIR